jgi:hypothetical protein
MSTENLYNLFEYNGPYRIKTTDSNVRKGNEPEAGTVGIMSVYGKLKDYGKVVEQENC